jgi:hypothetical protein
VHCKTHVLARTLEGVRGGGNFFYFALGVLFDFGFTNIAKLVDRISTLFISSAEARSF